VRLSHRAKTEDKSVSDEPQIEQVEAALRTILAETGEWPRPVARAVLVGPAGHVMRGTTRWECPGGLDEGETTLDAALREAREEACCVGPRCPELRSSTLGKGVLTRTLSVSASLAKTDTARPSARGWPPAPLGRRAPGP